MDDLDGLKIVGKLKSKIAMTFGVDSIFSQSIIFDGVGRMICIC